MPFFETTKISTKQIEITQGIMLGIWKPITHTKLQILD